MEKYAIDKCTSFKLQRNYKAAVKNAEPTIMGKEMKGVEKEFTFVLQFRSHDRRRI